MKLHDRIKNEFLAKFFAEQKSPVATWLFIGISGAFYLVGDTLLRPINWIRSKEEKEK